MQPIPHLPSLSGHRHPPCALHNPQQGNRKRYECTLNPPAPGSLQQARELGTGLASQTRLSLFVISKPLKKGGRPPCRKGPSLHHTQVGYSKKGVLGTAYGFGEKEPGGLRKIKSVSRAPRLGSTGQSFWESWFIAPPVVWGTGRGAKGWDGDGQWRRNPPEKPTQKTEGNKTHQVHPPPHGHLVV